MSGIKRSGKDRHWAGSGKVLVEAVALSKSRKNSVFSPAPRSSRRVLDGEQVPPDQKVYSIFEDHTHLIKRGKARKPVEFGHKVFLAESSQGLKPESSARGILQ
jgi:hypothetical protein